jgi:hypothetical protein
VDRDARALPERAGVNAQLRARERRRNRASLYLQGVSVPSRLYDHHVGEGSAIRARRELPINALGSFSEKNSNRIYVVA